MDDLWQYASYELRYECYYMFSSFLVLEMVQLWPLLLYSWHRWVVVWPFRLRGEYARVYTITNGTKSTAGRGLCMVVLAECKPWLVVVPNDMCWCVFGVCVYVFGKLPIYSFSFLVLDVNGMIHWRNRKKNTRDENQI